MRSVLIFLLFLSACSSKKSMVEDMTSNPKKYNVSGTFMKKSNYCGGARPSQAILEKFKTPKPLSNFKIYVIKGSENLSTSEVVDSTRTSENGTFSLSLPSGNYVLVSEAQKNGSYLTSITDREHIKVVDQKCLDNWVKMGLKQITVIDKDLVNVDYLLKKKCDIPDGIPCVKYTGPKRP